MPSFTAVPVSPSGWVVACLCAAWCRTCGDYAKTFATVARGAPDDAFVWTDIEDDSDWVDDLDVENFPTLLVAFNGEPRFYGPLLPHAQQLVRLLASLKAAGAAPAGLPAAAQPLAQRLWAAVEAGDMTL